jgi:Ribosomal protein S16
MWGVIGLGISVSGNMFGVSHLPYLLFSSELSHAFLRESPENRHNHCCVGNPQRLGWYDPLRKETNLNAPSIKKWLDIGAQPSRTVENLLKKAMVIEAK